MPAPDVALAHRPGVELVNTGSWQLLSGSWEPNRKDILAAVEAAQCPAVRRPKLKLGHLDPRFNEPEGPQFDGTPSLGWFDNLRASADGNTLIGDQVALPWLSQVQAAAWPDRSIEGKKNIRCALGHTHPFVVTAVSLLGETPPGIPTLRSIKSIDDLPAALGVAASGQDTEGGEDVQATVRAAAELGESDDEPVHTGAMVALIPTVEDAARLAVEGGESADELHVTLAYLGEAADLGTQGQQDVIDAVSATVNGMPTVDADVFALSIFNPGAANDREPCIVYGLSGDFLDAVHDFIMQSLGESAAGTRIPPQHQPWCAHITGQYTDDLGVLASLVDRVGPVRFDRVRLAFGDKQIDIPLIDWAVEPVDPSEVADDDGMVAAAAGDRNQLKSYWTTGPGLAKWRDKPHPWTALYRQLLKFLSVDEAKRTASSWYRLVTGHMPNEGVKAAESPPAEPTPDLPAAEPEQPITDPKEDLVSTELSALRSRLGLEDSADLDAITAAVDELKAKADTPPAPTEEMVAASAAAVEQAKTAEAEKDELRKEVQILASQVKTVSDELATTKAEKAADVKASVISAAVKEGKIKPADKEAWEKDYDEAPSAVTRVLASLAVGTAVPVLASGTVGSAEAESVDDEYEALVAALDGPKAV